MLFTRTTHAERKIVIPAVLPKAIGSLSAFYFSRLLKRVEHWKKGKLMNQQVTTRDRIIYKQVSTVFPGFSSACFLLFTAFRTFFLGPSSI